MLNFLADALLTGIPREFVFRVDGDHMMIAFRWMKKAGWRCRFSGR
jgi:hypothetical protein